MKSVVCDRCSSKIAEGNGYAFYSSAEMNGKVFGNMFLCETCTDSIITEVMFSQRFGPTEVSPRDYTAMREAINKATASGIAERCRAHGFSPVQARAKAKELAELFWKDQVAGGRAIEAFWTSPGKKTGCFVATAVYSSEHCEEVVLLRSLRDRVIIKYSIGRALIWSYYKTGPWVAHLVSNNEWLKRLLKRVFDQYIIPTISRILESEGQ